MSKNIQLLHGDIPSDLDYSNGVAIDTEAMGLNNKRDRLCLIQISTGKNDAYLVKMPMMDEIGDIRGKYPNLLALLEGGAEKLFHYARFDIAILQHTFGIDITNIYCTKIASRLARTYTESHSMKELCNDLLGVKISKQQQASDWGRESLSKEQMQYAANDVLYLHDLRDVLNGLLVREGRRDLAQECFGAIPVIAKLDILDWGLKMFCHGSSGLNATPL